MKIQRLQQNIDAISTYTSAHAELREAHHFLYDLRFPPSAKPRFVVIGINPGERSADWLISPKPTEETSRYDFHVELGVGRAALRWPRAAKFFLDGQAYVQTELFFWSSKNMSEFRQRFGLLRESPHLEFCVSMNRSLMEFYEPQAVIFPGLTQSRLCARLFDLELLDTVRLQGVKLIERYWDGERSWLFTKHWTGSFGFSNPQRAAVRDYILACQFERLKELVPPG